MVAPAVGVIWLSLVTSVAFPESLLYLVAWTTVCWLAATWLTPPESEQTLVSFYTRVRPGGPGWARVAAAAGAPPPEPIRGQLLDWAAGVALVYGTLFGVGALVFSGGLGAVPYLATAVGCGSFLYRRFATRGWAGIPALPGRLDHRLLAGGDLADPARSPSRPWSPSTPRVRPGGPGWARVAAAAGAPPPEPIRGQLLDWAAGVALVYGTLFGVGALVFSGGLGAVPYLATAVGCGSFLYRRFATRGWATVTG